MAERQAVVFPVAGGVEQSPPKQTPVDFDLLVNWDASDGTLRPRRGWRPVRYVNSWNTESVSGTDRYVPGGYGYLARDLSAPLGSYLYSSPSGSEYIIKCWIDSTLQSYAAVFDTTGKQFSDHASTGQPLLGSGKIDPIDRPYVFTVFGRFVYFTNGGLVWRWSEYTNKIEDCTNDSAGRGFRANPLDKDQNVYFTDMYGATIVHSHLGRMLYAGFRSDDYLSASGAIDSNNDGLVTIDDLKDGQGYKVIANKQAVQPQPYALWASDPRMPRCVKVSKPGSIVDLPSTNAITGLATLNRQLVIFTETEMYVANTGLTALQKVCDIGCASHRSIAISPTGLMMWVAPGGVYGWNGAGQPQKMSSGLDPMWRGEAAYDLPRKLTDFVPQQMQLPYRVTRKHLHLASGTIVRERNYYVVALSAGSGVEPNNVLVCCSYVTGKCWIYTAPGQRMPDDDTGSGAAGCLTLMSSPREPDVLWAQTEVVKDPDLGVSSYSRVTAVYALTGENDAYYDGSTFNERTFELFALTNRVLLGDPSEKLPRYVDVRMYGLHRDDFLALDDIGGIADINKAWIAVMPEESSFDLNEQSQTTANTTEFASTFSAWPDTRLADTCFWMSDAANAASVGRWDNGSTSADKYWMSTPVFDKHIDIRGVNTQFVRFAFWKKVDSSSYAPLHIVNMTVGMNNEERGRRR